MTTRYRSIDIDGRRPSAIQFEAMTQQLRLAAWVLFMATAACAHSGQRSFRSSANAYDAALASRADSLIQRLATTPGEFVSGGHVFNFYTDYELLEDLGALGARAAPALIECLDDVRPSSVTYLDRSTGERRQALVGVLCHFVLQDGPLGDIRDERQERDEAYLDYSANADALRRAKEVWQRYPDLARRNTRKATRSAAGCYLVSLRRTKGDVPIDTSRRWRIELDSMPLPGTVRPDHFELAPGLTLDGRAYWRPYHEGKGAFIYWRSRDNWSRLNMAFGADDPSMSGWHFARGAWGREETSGDLSVERARCK